MIYGFTDFLLARDLIFLLVFDTFLEVSLTSNLRDRKRP